MEKENNVENNVKADDNSKKTLPNTDADVAAAEDHPAAKTEGEISIMKKIGHGLWDFIQAIALIIFRSIRGFIRFFLGLTGRNKVSFILILLAFILVFLWIGRWSIDTANERVKKDFGVSYDELLENRDEILEVLD